ncbi:MAG: hypothetical protein ACK46X_14160, partial [Candidatus Sericytochromatia bacterium]
PVGGGGGGGAPPRLVKPAIGAADGAAFVPPATPSGPVVASTPLPSPPAALTPAHEAIRGSLGGKLAELARVGFVQAQAAILTNNGAGVIAQNGASLISNNGGGLVSDRGAGYRLAQSAGAVATAPLPGEALVVNSRWADDSRLLIYYKPETYSAENPEMRRVNVNPAGHGLSETLRRVTAAWPSNLPKDLVDHLVQAGDDGRFLYKLIGRLTYDEAGVGQTIDIGPGETRWDDARSGITVEVDAFKLSHPADSGSYAYRFPKLGLVETGTLTKLRRRADQRFAIELMNPERMGDVQSRIEKTDGTLLFTRSVVKAGDGQIHTYDLQGGLALRFDRQEQGHLVGKLLVNGHAEADAKLERRSGAHIVSIAFPEDQTHPLVVGYGSLSGTPEPGDAAPQALWHVATAAGSEAPGTADGAGQTARFKLLSGLAASRVNPNRLYAVDRGAHVVRVLDVDANGVVTAGTFAGTGVAGAAEGARLQASFNQPSALAVGPDDTLYLTDTGNRKIRRIAPDGTVSTVAGSGAAGIADGPAASATFLAPAGLALDGTGGLWVSDAGAHTLRKVSADGTVGTVAGTAGATGRTDGVGSAARFNAPLGLALSAQGRVLVADSQNFSLREVTADGTVSTLAGNADTNRVGLDGAPLTVCLYGLNSIAVGPSGRPYLGGDNVRMLRADGRIGSYAGAHASLHQDSSHLYAAFTSIGGLAFGPGGVLYVADGTRLRSITPKNAPAP